MVLHVLSVYWDKSQQIEAPIDGRSTAVTPNKKDLRTPFHVLSGPFIIASFVEK